MTTKCCRRALLTSIAIEHEHGRTDVLTENYSPLGGYLTLGITRRGAARFAGFGDEISPAASAARGLEAVK